MNPINPGECLPALGHPPFRNPRLQQGFSSALHSNVVRSHGSAFIRPLGHRSKERRSSGPDRLGFCSGRCRRRAIRGRSSSALYRSHFPPCAVRRFLCVCLSLCSVGALAVVTVVVCRLPKIRNFPKMPSCL